MKKRLLLFIVFGTFAFNSYSQETDSENEKKNLVNVALGYTFIPKAGNEGASEAHGVFIPAIGIDYFRRIGKQWEIGIMADLELGHYIIINENLNRENAALLVAMANYNLTKHINILAGAGMEFEKHKNLAIIRLGGEYSIRLKRNWVISPGFFYDFKEGYDTWSLSIGFGKEF
jgi:hypothetical protein